VHISKVLLPCIIGVALSGAASAEVYESKDAEGNTVYSDRPSQGAEEVKVAPTNSADPVAITPRPQPSPEKPAKPRKAAAKPAGSKHEDTEETDYDDLYYGDHNYDGELDDQTKREKRRDDNVAKPKREPPVKVEPHRNVSRPAGGGGGRR
jgi:hypothetical protein